MESVLESVFVPCPNAKFGCNLKIPYGKEPTHERECTFSQCLCPVEYCNYTCSYRNLYAHHCFYTHHGTYSSNGFTCGNFVSVQMNISEKILFEKERRLKLLFVVQCFKEPCGVYVTVSCIAPPNPEVGRFSYHLSYTVDGHTMTYESPEVKRILKVSSQRPEESFMLILDSLLRGDSLDMKLCIKKLKHSVV